MTEHFHVFISYSREFDLQAAINLQDQLVGAKLSVFRDEDSIQKGQDWLEALELAVDGCDCFILLIGKGGMSCWMENETRIAKHRYLDPRDKNPLHIFPIFIDSFNAENFFSSAALLKPCNTMTGLSQPASRKA